MPLVDSGEAAFYDGGPTSMYIPALAREHWYDGFREGAKDLILAMESVGLQQGQRIVFAHAMFGWHAEEFIAQGYGPYVDGSSDGRIVCIEPSVWIHENTAGNATLPIVDEDIAMTGGRRAIKQLFGSSNTVIDWVVAYEILPDLADKERAGALADLRALATQVVHWVTPLLAGPPAQDERLQLKTIDEWKALVAPDYVVERGMATIV